MVARDGQGRQITADPCPMCGKRTKRRPRTGKLRYAHRCPHGFRCPAGQPRLGEHLNTYPPVGGCDTCRATLQAGRQPSASTPASRMEARARHWLRTGVSPSGVARLRDLGML